MYKAITPGVVHEAPLPGYTNSVIIDNSQLAQGFY